MSLPSDWWNTIKLYLTEDEKRQLQDLSRDLPDLYREQSIAPDYDHIFMAYEKTPLSQVKAVILGQDPYPTPGNGMGLAFSVTPGLSVPASLKNIFKEYQDDLGKPAPSSGDLTPWAERGVLLLNTTLTVKVGQPNSHRRIGWEPLTRATIQAVNAKHDPVVFLLWGRHAQSYQEYITNHPVIISSHPSPLGATKTKDPFLGSKPFSRTNSYLDDPIDWTLP